MRNSTDPSVHREREKQLISHVERLIEDERLRLDTTRGRRPITTLIRHVQKNDKTRELKGLMAEMDRPDRELQAKMPLGESLDVTLSQKSLWFFKKQVGKLQVLCVSPTRELIAEKTPELMTGSDITKILTDLAAKNPVVGVPSTIVLLSTGGFTRESHTLAERRADRTLILVEPNDAGGWTVTGPPEMQALVDLFDPERDDAKRQRVRSYLEERHIDLLSGGLAADAIVARTQIPQQIVESELKSYAKENPGLAAKRLDGRLVLFQEAASAALGATGTGGDFMPFIDRMKTLFSHKGNDEKKAALLAERKAALTQQRDRLFEDMSAMETKETELREEFKASPSALTKRRLTSQLLQFRKDIERRQQLLAMLGQQVNVVSTALHNLELVRQGHSAKLPTSEELTNDAVKAEEIMAELEADSEIAASISPMGAAGMSDEEQALFEELEREAAGSTGAAKTTGASQTSPDKVPSASEKKPAEKMRPEQQASAPTRAEPRRGEAEPG